MHEVRNILICPLEWGLGHAGRMIPVASGLLGAGNNVFIGSGSELADLFRNEIDGLKYISFPGFRIRYSRWLPQYIKIILSAPSFIFHIRREHRLLKGIIRDYRIDVVISDSRLGLWNNKITTVLVTHMMRVPYPKALRFLENAGRPLMRHLLSRFDFCYIPDLPGEINLSGKLSHGLDLPLNTRHIGILSKFGKAPGSAARSHKYFCTVILSGPEPQRSILKKKLTLILEESGKPSMILEGRPGEKTEINVHGNITFISHLPSGEMRDLILDSELIITRSGYTTLMELVTIGKSALIIPTPGQAEQEYLAELMAERGWFRTVSQNQLTSQAVFPLPEVKWPAGIYEESRELLQKALSELLEK